MSVADNGKGISGDKRDDSYGMANMQERAGEIGFNFTIRSENGSGTKLMLTEK
jgi:signal transduction histidine kinase